MNYIITFLFSLFVSSFFIPNLEAQIFHYEDEDGRMHYVDSENKIPEKYKESIKKDTDFPTISKVSGPQKQKNESKNKTDDTASEKTDSPQKPLNDSKELDPSNYKLELFVADWCSFCVKLEASLQEKGINYDRFDIENSDFGKRTYSELGKGAIPISRINRSKIIRGNHPDKIIEALNNAD